VKLLPLRTFDGSGTAYTADIIAAIIYAESQGAQIINCSWGAQIFNQALFDVISESDALFVTSAGNSRMDSNVTPTYPAGYDLANVISVASTNSNDSFSFFSNYGSIDIAALGRGVNSALPGGRYGEQSGTSVSAAFVSGIAAAVLSQEDLTAAALRLRLINTADSLSNLENKVTGGKRINIANALVNVQGANLILSPPEDFDVHGYQRTDDENWHLFSGLDIVQIEAGHNSSYALASDGSVWAWGDNSYGQLGDGTMTNRLSPVQVLGLTDVIEIAIYTSLEYNWNFGFGGGIARKSDDSVWEWRGGLGGPATPYQVFGLVDVKAVSAGDNHALALDSNGSAWSWGDNLAGQLGVACLGCGSPMEVSTLSGMQITGIAAGAMSSYFRDINGGVWATGGPKMDDGDWYWWSYSNSTQYYLSVGGLPLQYGGIGSTAKIMAGGNFGFALQSNGNAWLLPGYSPNPSGLEPAEQLNLSGVTSLDSSGWHDIGMRILASTSNGNVWSKEYDIQSYSWPTAFSQVSGLSGITAVSAGYNHSLALDDLGRVWSWGENSSGQLGNDTTTSSSVPVLVNMSGSPPTPVPTYILWGSPSYTLGKR